MFDESPKPKIIPGAPAPHTPNPASAGLDIEEFTVNQHYIFALEEDRGLMASMVANCAMLIVMEWAGGRAVSAAGIIALAPWVRPAAVRHVFDRALSAAKFIAHSTGLKIPKTDQPQKGD